MPPGVIVTGARGWPSHARAMRSKAAGTSFDAWSAVANTIARYEPVGMVVDPTLVGEARARLAPSIEIVPLPLDDAWMRDIGPTFLLGPEGRLGAVDWVFNGWGQQEWATWDRDAEIAPGSSPEPAPRASHRHWSTRGAPFTSTGRAPCSSPSRCCSTPTATRDGRRPRWLPNCGQRSASSTRYGSNAASRPTTRCTARGPHRHARRLRAPRPDRRPRPARPDPSRPRDLRRQPRPATASDRRPGPSVHRAHPRRSRRTRGRRAPGRLHVRQLLRRQRLRAARAGSATRRTERWPSCSAASIPTAPWRCATPRSCSPGAAGSTASPSRSRTSGHTGASVGSRNPTLRGDHRMGSFLTDVETIRRRARAEIERGPITESYTADRPRLLAVLNEVLATELVCVLRYKRHYYMASGSTPAAWPPSSSSMRPRNRVTPTRWRPASSNSRASPTSTRPARVAEPRRVRRGRHARRDDQRGPGGRAGGDRVVPGDHPLDRQRRPDHARWMLESILAVEEEHADDLLNLLGGLPER